MPIPFVTAFWPADRISVFAHEWGQIQGELLKAQFSVGLFVDVLVGWR